MNAPKNLPIFCDKCSTLAFAVLDSAPLCESCLFKQVAAARGTLLNALNIEPLEFIHPHTIHGRESRWV